MSYMYNVLKLLLVAGSSSAPLLDLVSEQVYILTVLGEHELIDREGKLELKGTVQVQQLRGSSSAPLLDLVTEQVYILTVLGCSEPDRTSGQNSVAHTRRTAVSLDPKYPKTPAHTFYSPTLVL